MYYQYNICKPLYSIMIQTHAMSWHAMERMQYVMSYSEPENPFALVLRDSGEILKWNVVSIFVI